MAEKPQQDSRRGEIAFRIKPHTPQRCSEGSNKPCVPKELLIHPNQTQKAILCAKPDSKGDILYDSIYMEI